MKASILKQDPILRLKGTLVRQKLKTLEKVVNKDSEEGLLNCHKEKKETGMYGDDESLVTVINIGKCFSNG